MSPVVSMKRLTAYGSQSRSSEMRVRTPRPEGGCHQCCTSPSSELARGGAQQMLARDVALRDAESQHILQLVAEAVRAAHLVEAGAAPDAAAQRLVEQPAIQEQVHGGLGRGDLHGAEDVVPGDA